MESLAYWALLVGFVASLAGLALGRVLRRPAPRLAHVLHFSASALSRALAGAVCAAVAIGTPSRIDSLAVAIPISCVTAFLAIYLLAMTLLMLYVAVKGPEHLQELASGPQQAEDPP
jgi:hypothetical protein